MWSPMYMPHQEDPIYPTKGIKACWRDQQNDANRGDLQPTWLVVLGLIGKAEP